MALRLWKRCFFRASREFYPRKNCVNPRKHRQTRAYLVKICNVMSLSLSARKMVLCWAMSMFSPALIFSQNVYAPQAGQYPVVGSLQGDQVFPQISLKASGG